MSANTHLSVAAWNAMLDAGLNALNGGFLEIYAGSQPATPDVALTGQTLLATLPLSATAFTAASAGTKTANAITSAAAAAVGTAAWFRAYKSDAATAVIDGSVGVSGADLNMADVALTTGGTVSVTSWSVSMPVGQ